MDRSSSVGGKRKFQAQADEAGPSSRGSGGRYGDRSPADDPTSISGFIHNVSPVKKKPKERTPILQL